MRDGKLCFAFLPRKVIIHVNKKLTPGKRATAVCVWRLVFAISPLFDAPSWGTLCDINAIYTSL